MIELKEVLSTVVKPIVTKPDEVNIIEKGTEKDVLLQLSVAPEDMGKVIGRHGKIAKAIRTVMMIILYICSKLYFVMYLI